LSQSAENLTFGQASQLGSEARLIQEVENKTM